MSFRPALRPGAQLLRRDASTLQVGTSPGVVLIDRPGLLPLLRMIDGSRDITQLQVVARSSITELEEDVAAVIRELQALGVIFDASRWTDSRRRGLDSEARHLDLHGNDPDRLAARPQAQIAFHSDPLSRPFVNATRTVLSHSGVGALDSADPDLLVVVSCGEPSRSIFDRPMMESLNHLLVMIDEDRVRIGPLVRPARSPCVGCADLHRADWDPTWSFLLPQLGRHSGTRTPPALSAVTIHAAAVELAAEVLAYCDGLRGPSRFLVIGPRHDERDSSPVAFHHRCGCGLLSHPGAA